MRTSICEDRMDNSEIAGVFYEVADILELQSVAFKPQAYRRAAAAIERLEVPVSRVMEEGGLEDIPGVGKAIAEKIMEMVSTGRLAYLERLRAEVPPGIVEMMDVPDIGPKTALLLHSELGVASVADLKAAAEAHRIRGLKGFGERAEERILQGIRTFESKGGRTLLGEALPVAERYVEHLRDRLRTDSVSICGSLRRGRETIGDIDILVGGAEPGEATELFLSYDLVDQVLMSGDTKSSVRLRGGLQVDLRVVGADEYGAALQYFTGSKEHNVRVRRLGVELGLKVNEYGVFERDSGKRVAGPSEAGVYEALGLSPIPPELREDSGEMEASREGRLPDLVDAAEMKGDLHVHTDWSDGADSVEEIVAAAVQRGYGFVAITDHSQSLTIANGLSPARLREQVDVVRRVEEKHDGVIRVLAGSEVDIKADGSLDLPHSVLADLDIVVASVHSKLRMESGEMTQRVVSAIETGGVDILGHPTGRLIGRRDPVSLDIVKVFEAAAENGVAMEINSFPDRLDLRDTHCRLAKEHGLAMAIGTDSHSVRHLDYLRLGVLTARRGWLGAEDVLNTRDVEDLVARFGGGGGR